MGYQVHAGDHLYMPCTEIIVDPVISPLMIFFSVPTDSTDLELLLDSLDEGDIVVAVVSDEASRK